MNYSESPHMVRGDFFKPSGKWYITEAISMEHCWDITTAVHAVAAAWWANGQLTGASAFNLVVLEPWHRNAHPVMLDVPGMESCIEDLTSWMPDLVDHLRQIKVHKELTANA